MAEKLTTGEFEDFILNYEKLIFNIAYRMFLNYEDAGDVTQEVCIKLFKNFYKKKNIISEKAWVYRVTYNTCIDEIRKRKGKETFNIDDELNIQSSEKSPEESLIKKEDLEYIEKALNNLPNEHRRFIVMRDLNMLSYAEIADIADIPEGTVKSKINRARKKLRNLILNETQREQKNI